MAKHKELSKTRGQRIHAKSRARERYGITLNRKQLIEVVQLIQNRKGIFVERQSNRVTRWLVSYQNETLHVVYDSQRHNIATFLPIKKYEIDVCDNEYCKCSEVNNKMG